jgi:cytidyltransferase-like protein
MINFLKEGGNVFKDKKTGKELTQRINQQDVLPTVQWLEQQTGLNLVDNMLGTTGKKATSGDLDLGVDENQISKDELVTKLLIIKGIGKDDVKKGGNNVHLKTPIAGDPSNGFVQTDFMFGDPEWMKFSMQGGGHNSPYRGTHKHILLASIAKATKSKEHPEGMKWSYLNGLMDRATDKTISKDPDTIAEILLGSGHSGLDLSNVETIVNAIKDRPEFDELVAEANETFAKDKSHPVPPVTRMLQEGLENRIQHPEDMIYWEGSRGAQKAINGLLELAENATSTTTVKWDGSPAIVFGIDKDDKFILTDKGGFTVKSYKGRAESQEELESMIKARGEKAGKDYSEFASSLSGIFEPFKTALKQIDKESGQGVFFKGDLLYMRKPTLVDGQFEFKPNVVTYRVPAESELGKKIANSTIGVVLHGIIKEEADGSTTEESLEDITSYFHGDLSSGGLSAGPVLIFAPVFVNDVPKFELEMVKKAEDLQEKIESSSASIDSVLDDSELTAKKMKDLPDVLYSYTNSKADNFSTVSSNDFKSFIENNQKLSKSKITSILAYIESKQNGFRILFQIVKEIEQLKNELVSQFDRQSTAVKAFIGSTPGGEGYVVKGSSGLIKLVNRGGFTAANRALIREEKTDRLKAMKKIGYYPGSFKPFHRGHYESILDAKNKVDELNVIASASDRVRPGEFPLSGQVSKDYLEKYIKPALKEEGINLIISTGSPVTDVFELIEEQSTQDIFVYLFAGPDDLDRFRPDSIKRTFPKLSKKQRIKVEPTKVIMGGDGEERISGTATRQALEDNDLSGFKAMLPNIPSVQKDAKKIMNAFKTAGKKIAEEEAEKAAAKAAAKKTKSKTIKKESVLFEFIVLLLKEQIILNKK